VNELRFGKREHLLSGRQWRHDRLAGAPDVRASVAVGGKTDISRTTHFGSEWTSADMTNIEME
jgi:hypothetical protein